MTSSSTSGVVEDNEKFASQWVLRCEQLSELDEVSEQDIKELLSDGDGLVNSEEFLRRFEIVSSYIFLCGMLGNSEAKEKGNQILERAGQFSELVESEAFAELKIGFNSEHLLAANEEGEEEEESSTIDGKVDKQIGSAPVIPELIEEGNVMNSKFFEFLNEVFTRFDVDKDGTFLLKGENVERKRRVLEEGIH